MEEALLAVQEGRDEHAARALGLAPEILETARGTIEDPPILGARQGTRWQLE